MTILVNTVTGSQKAIDLLSIGWEARKTPGDDNSIDIVTDSGEKFSLELSQYQKMIDKLSSSDNFLNLAN